MTDLRASKLIRYWHSPAGKIHRNVGGWRLGRLLKTGRKFYHIHPYDPADTRTAPVKFRIDWTQIQEVNDDGSPK